MSDAADDAHPLDALWAPYQVPHEPVAHDSARCAGCAVPELDDATGLVVRRGVLVYAALHPRPQAPGHLLVRPYRHVASLAGLDGAEADELGDVTREAMRTLRATSGPAGLNLGVNESASPTPDEHLHQHVVPRWPGDHNFMPVVARTRTLPELLAATREALAAAWIPHGSDS